MRVAIVHNAVTDKSTIDELDVLVQVDSIGRSLIELGHETHLVPCTFDLLALRRRLESLRPDAVFNLVESLDARGRLIHLAPFLFDAMGLPYTGAPAEAIFITSQKVIAKQWLRASGLPTPDWFGPYPENSPNMPRTIPPNPAWAAGFLIKAAWEHASFNLEGEGLVAGGDISRLRDLMKERAPAMGGVCFAEMYIEGREFNLSVIDGPDGPIALPPAEIVFEDFPEDKLRIVGYRAKWDEESFEYTHTSRRFDFPPEDAGLVERLKELALRCWHAVGMRGYARVDFRVDRQGRPWVLEANANPCFSPYGGFLAALKQEGFDYTKGVELILAAAFRKQYEPAPAREAEPRRKSGAPKTGEKSTGISFRYDVQPDDSTRLPEMVAATGFFNAEELDIVKELVDDCLEMGPEASGYDFVFAERDGRAIGFACYGPIAGTESSFSLYWITVHPDFQDNGIGRALMDETERLIRAAGGSRLYIETSNRTQYSDTRAFYELCGCKLASLLEDYYAPGDAKATYFKKF